MFVAENLVHRLVIKSFDRDRCVFDYRAAELDVFLVVKVMLLCCFFVYFANEVDHGFGWDFLLARKVLGVAKFWVRGSLRFCWQVICQAANRWEFGLHDTPQARESVPTSLVKSLAHL